MKQNVIKIKSFDFAIKIINCYKFLADTKKEYVLSKQLLKSGTAIGALHREAEQAESKNDFIHKLSIALKECNECIYWLELLVATNYISQDQFENIHTDASEIIKLLTSIIKTSKGQ